MYNSDKDKTLLSLGTIVDPNNKAGKITVEIKSYNDDSPKLSINRSVTVNEQEVFRNLGRMTMFELSELKNLINAPETSDLIEQYLTLEKEDSNKSYKIKIKK